TGTPGAIATVRSGYRGRQAWIEEVAWPTLGGWRSTSARRRCGGWSSTSGDARRDSNREVWVQGETSMDRGGGVADAWVLALDLGTSSVRALVFDGRGRPAR